jgi:hypothetical protein
MKRNKPKLKLWRITEDCVTHTVTAFNQWQALALLVETCGGGCWEWPTEQPKVEEIPPDKRIKIDDDGVITEMLASKWTRQVGSPVYLACSEY